MDRETLLATLAEVRKSDLADSMLTERERLFIDGLLHNPPPILALGIYQRARAILFKLTRPAVELPPAA